MKVDVYKTDQEGWVLVEENVLNDIVKQANHILLLAYLGYGAAIVFLVLYLLEVT